MPWGFKRLPLFQPPEGASNSQIQVDQTCPPGTYLMAVFLSHGIKPWVLHRRAFQALKA